ncbi:hypothetical protein EDI28_14600 [Photobacterium chitinilyticum]|uniref:DUF1090 family protein n=1 Tax=Photobacterium chitinilyticum TaxID=2485123 RepID=A0A444JPG9_9GAMM|nr:hypothetical protein EDI28_14600 [Photobacterium chitinilyticum]
MFQKILSSILVIFLLSASPMVAANSTKNEQCVKIRTKIDKIHSKMRHKYTNKQGVKYRKQLDKLYKDEFKYCF